MSEPREEDQMPFERSSIAAIGGRRRWFSREAAAPEADTAEKDRQALPFERSSIAAIGGRRRWFSREAAAPKADTPEKGGQAYEPPSMLGALASRAGMAPAPERRSLLSLEGAGEPSPPAEPDPPAAPRIAHSTLGVLAGLEEHSSRAFPIERAILISLFAHVLVVIMLTVSESRRPQGIDPLIAALTPPERDDSPIPVIFQDAPGPSRENPKRSPLSDADRRAGGGDRSRPKADTPFTPPSPGIAGLQPGPRGPRVPASAPARPGAAAEEDRQASEKADRNPNATPSEFPADMRPKLGQGPSEVTRLAGLDAAIRDAARSTVGGEGGAPEGDPDGGFVDSGPLSFDTTWYDWGPYGAEMVRRIKLHWDVPELARLGWKGSLTVRFFILANGTVADAKIIRGSGVPPFDFAALQAILKSSPFRPLPADLHSTREGVTVTFLYNMRPESLGRTSGP